MTTIKIETKFPQIYRKLLKQKSVSVVAFMLWFLFFIFAILQNFLSACQFGNIFPKLQCII
jgi:hypothetical protein